MPKKKTDIRPTKEELQENIDQALKDLDGIPQPPVEGDINDKDEEDELEIEDKKEEEDDKPEEKEEDIEEEKEEPKKEENKEKKIVTPPIEEKKEEKPEEKEEEPDYKDKYTHSTAEAQVLASQNRKMSEAMVEASKLPLPTDEEMQKEIPEWEDMTDAEKRIVRRQVHSERKFALIEKAGTEGKEIGEWSDKVDSVLADPEIIVKHPELEGKEEAFKTFAIKPSRRGGDFEDLISAFLYTVKSEVKPARKEKMFETGTGGDEKPKPKDGKISLAEARRLRITDYPKFLTYLKAKKIDQSEL